MSLFGGVASQSHSRNLVEFKAGKMNLRGKMVYPDKRKGLVYIYQGNDMLMHLCWKERSNNSAEDDLVIFPEEVEFKKVTQNTTGRVYILKWRSNTRKLFFWMQEPKEDKDEEFCKKINDLLNQPPTPGFDDDSNGTDPLQSLMERMARGGGSGIDPNDLSNVLRGMNPNDFASLLSSFGGSSGGAAGTTQGARRGRGTNSSLLDISPQQTADFRPNTAPAGTAATSTNRSGGSSSSAKVPKASNRPKGGPIQINTLTNVLTNLGGNTSQESGTASSKPTIDFYDIITHENLVPLLSNKGVQEKLRPHLPEGNTIPNTEKEVRESISSPQFRQIVHAFSTALESGELGSVLSQFNFPDEVTQAVNQGDLIAFAQAIEKHYNTMDTK